MKSAWEAYCQGVHGIVYVLDACEVSAQEAQKSFNDLKNLLNNN